jgi:hypothetical protein
MGCRIFTPEHEKLAYFYTGLYFILRTRTDTQLLGFQHPGKHFEEEGILMLFLVFFFWRMLTTRGTTWKN